MSSGHNPKTFTHFVFLLDNYTAELNREVMIKIITLILSFFHISVTSIIVRTLFHFHLRMTIRQY